MNIQQALDKLFSLHQFGIKLGLEKIIDLLNHIGNPQINLKIIHVAGSNGKGSTSSFMASILVEAGYKVGLYTSPHLVKFNERVRINGVEIPDEYIAQFMTQLESYIDEHEPTFFELTTAIAFQYFNEQNVDYAVIEVGLGGRLDATNTITPMASVITQIGLEHTNILGESIKEIAYEKSCIIKENSKVFVGFVSDEAGEVISAKAEEMGNSIYSLKKFTTLYDNNVVVHAGNTDYNIYTTPLRGRYQLFNSALAVLVISNLFKLDVKIIYKGINNVISNSGIQGRYEVYCETPKIIFEAAHNFDGLKVFLDEFAKEKEQYKKRTVIFGCMKDKNASAMLKLLKTNFDIIYVASINYERAHKIEDLIIIANNEGIEALPATNPAQFIYNFEREENNSCLVVLGSIYLLGDIKEKMLELKRA